MAPPDLFKSKIKNYIVEKYFKPKSDIIHYSQLNNKNEPYAACFPTSLAMALRNNGYEYSDSEKGFDDYIFELAATDKYKAEAKKLSIPVGAKLHQYCAIMCIIANDLMAMQGIKKIAKRVPYNIATVKHQIDAGNMMVCGTYFTNYGHMICISGYTETSVIVNDPYGNINELYHFNSGNKLDDGALVILDKHHLSKLSFLITF